MPRLTPDKRMAPSVRRLPRERIPVVEALGTVQPGVRAVRRVAVERLAVVAAHASILAGRCGFEVMWKSRQCGHL